MAPRAATAALVLALVALALPAGAHAVTFGADLNSLPANNAAHTDLRERAARRRASARST